MPKVHTRLLALALAGCIGFGPGAAVGQTAVVTAETEEVPVPEHAPMGTSGQIAAGAAIGILAGFVILAIAFSSGGD